MKKFISMLLCLAMVLSLCAVTFAAEATSATISFDDKANRTEFTTEKQVWVQNGITVTNDKAASTSNVADYAKPARFYKNSKLTIEYPGMTVIEFECNSTTYATALKSSITTGTATVNGKIVGVTLDAAADSYVIEALSGGQVRIDKITVYTGSAPVIPEQPEQPEQTQDPAADSKLTVKEALDLGASKEHDSYTTNKYYVTGVITEVYNTQYGNMKIADADGNILTIYGTYSADGSTRYDAMDVKPVAGDTVTIYGIIGQYNGTPQIKNGWITEHTVANPGTPEQPEQPETPTAPTYATEITVGTAYMLGMYSTSKSATYYFTGNMSGYYGATETTVDTAVSVYVEAATGGYYLYFVDANGAKQYINLVASGTHRNFTFAATATSVFTWDAEKDALYTEVEGENCYMGTYGTYVTVGVLQTSKLKDTDYIARLYTLNGSETPDVPDVPEEPEQPEQPSGNRADFETLNSEGTGQYTQSFTTANGWTTVNSAIQVGGPSVANPAFPVVGADNTHKAVCLNGKTSAVGKLTSPVLTGGISKLTMDYTKMFTDTKLSVTITITDLATGKTYTKTVSREEDKDTKYVVWTDEWVLETPITGDFTIEIVNDCPSATNSNKDRFTILNLAWESAEGGATEPEVNPDEEAAKAVDAQIEAIGEVTLEKETAITAARAAYEALSDAAKALVTKLETLTAAETELAAQKKAAADKAAADAVVAQINAIGEVTLNSKAAIDAARAAYEALTADQKALVGNLATLEVAEETLQALQQQADKEAVDKAAAAGVDALIEAIGEVTLEKETAIAAARAAYEALTADQKALVTKLDALTAAETRLQELKDAAAQAAADKAAADAAAALIEKIGTVTKNSEAAIAAARAAYDALTDAQKALVENYETLTKAEEAFKGIANTGDNTMMFVAMAILSMTAVVVLVSKKRAF